jgi:hypothetical protein
MLFYDAFWRPDEIWPDREIKTILDFNPVIHGFIIATFLLMLQNWTHWIQ